MKPYWMPLNIGEYRSDTAHFSPTERGIYISLLVYAWENGGRIPSNDAKLCRISGCDPRLWWQYKRNIITLFDTVDGSTMQHGRIVSELRRLDEISSKRKGAAMQMHSKRSANAEQMHTQLQPQLQKEERKKDKKEPLPSVADRAKRKAPLPNGWQPSPKSYEIAEEYGHSVQNVEKIFRDYLKSSGKQYVDYDAAFHNFIRNQSNFSKGPTNGIRQTSDNPARGSLIGAIDRRLAEIERESDSALPADNLFSLPNRPIQRS